MEDENEVKIHNVKKLKLADLLPDSKNMNKHTKKGMALLGKSLANNGFGRSILLDKDNKIIAGNATTEVAGESGYEDVIVVEVTGNQVVAVKRTDLSIDSAQGREIAMADNRVGEMNLDWDDAMLKANLSEEVRQNYGFKTDETVIISRPEYPIVPKFDEKYNAIVILCKNETDYLYMQSVLDIGMYKSYKNTKVGSTQVIDVNKFKESWEKR